MFVCFFDLRWLWCNVMCCALSSGDSYRAMKEKLGLSDIRKEANRMSFGTVRIKTALRLLFCPSCGC